MSISPEIVEELRRVASFDSVTWVEKAVDVMIATDMVSKAYENKYDIAYLLSADGDFTHAIKKVRDYRPESIRGITCTGESNF